MVSKYSEVTSLKLHVHQPLEALNFVEFSPWTLLCGWYLLKPQAHIPWVLFPSTRGDQPSGSTCKEISPGWQKACTMVENFKLKCQFQHVIFHCMKGSPIHFGKLVTILMGSSRCIVGHTIYRKLALIYQKPLLSSTYHEWPCLYWDHHACCITGCMFSFM